MTTSKSDNATGESEAVAVATDPATATSNSTAIGAAGVPEALSFSRALGGSWLNRPLIWIIGFAPNIALVAILEVSLLDESWHRIAVTAALQFCTAVLVLSASVFLMRRRSRILSLPTALTCLALTALAQSLVGGIFATAAAGGTPDFDYRIGFWLAVQWLWSPLVINTLAQYEHRRFLLAERTMHIDSWNHAAEQGIATLRDQHVHLLEAIRSTVSPVIDEIRQRFNGTSAPTNQAEFLSTAEQLTVLSQSVSSILARPHVADPLLVEIPEHPKRFAPIADAVNYEIRRPYASSALLAMLLLPVLAPGMFRIGGLPAIGELTLGVATSAFLFASGLQLIKLFSRANSRARMVQIAIVHVVASIAAPLVVSSMTWDPLGGRELVMVVLLPLGFIFAAVTIVGAFGLGAANLELINDVKGIRRRFSNFHDFVREEEKRMKDELEALLHGPIRGRLSACIMALKFHADELALADSARGESILRAVGQHLDATARDLDRMNVPIPFSPRPYDHDVASDD